MRQIHLNVLFLEGFSIFAKQINVVLTVNTTEVSVTHNTSPFLCEDAEVMTGLELLHLFSSRVNHFTSQLSMNPS